MPIEYEGTDGFLPRTSYTVCTHKVMLVHSEVIMVPNGGPMYRGYIEIEDSSFVPWVIGRDEMYYPDEMVDNREIVAEIQRRCLPRILESLRNSVLYGLRKVHV